MATCVYCLTKSDAHAIRIANRLKTAGLKESRESTLSAMPEGLLAPLTAQEAADLLEFFTDIAGAR